MAGAVPDVYFEPNIVLKHRMARRRVVTIHDLSFWSHPEWFPPAASLRTRLTRSLGEADAVITGSKTVRDELCGELGLSSDLVHVIYHGVDHAVFTPDGGEDAGLPTGLGGLGAYVLCVGSLEPRKNLMRLLTAYGMLDRTIREQHRLVIAGIRGWRSEEVTRKVEELTPAVTYLGYIERQELAALYRGSSLFVYPSLYEGFGLPPLEAMACGAPTLMSEIPVFREVFGKAALFCDTTRAESIAESLGAILDCPQVLALARERGVALAREFSWEESARAHLAVLHGVC